MDHSSHEITVRRNLLTGLVTAATKPWRNGFQTNTTPNNSNAVYPSISTAVNTSPTCQTSTTDSFMMAKEQRLRQQVQRHQDHKLNVLWYGGDDLLQQQQTPALIFESNRYHSTDDWEKQPLRQHRKKSQNSRRRQNRKKKPSSLPTIPVIWAAILHAMYAAAMAAVYYVYGVTSGSGWIWLRGITGGSSTSFFWWLHYLSPTWYYMLQAIFSTIIGCFWYRWCYQCQYQQQQRWCCYLLLILFSTALLPSLPLTEIFNYSNQIKTRSMDNSNIKQQDNLNLELFDDNQLALYEGLWQVSFFMFVAYCLLLPNKQLAIANSENVNNHQNDGSTTNKSTDDEDNQITWAVLLFSITSSFGHISLNAFTAYQWYFYHQENSKSFMVAIRQQLVANVVVLISVNLTGWLLRQQVVRDRDEVNGRQINGKFDLKQKRLTLTLRHQVNKLNLLLTSLLPRRVFMEMKHDIVSDAANSYNLISGSSNDKHHNELNFQQTRQELQLQISRQPKMYLKEYDNISVVYVNVIKFWDNLTEVTCRGESDSDSQSSCRRIKLIDRLLSLFRTLARRNHCLPMRLLGHRMYFVAGLPVEEGYGFYDDEIKNARWTLKENGHARDAIQLGLDLVNAINSVVHDVSRDLNGHKINLNARVGIHSGRVMCGVMGFTGGMGIPSQFGSHWQYDVWGHDVNVASIIELNGHPGRVNVSQATVNLIIKKGTTSTVTGLPHSSHTNNSGLDSSDNKDDFTFERVHGEQRDNLLRLNRIDTYVVVPNSMCSNLEIYGNSIKTNDDNIGVNHFSEDIESLILQSLENQLQLVVGNLQNVTTSSALETEMLSGHQLPTTTTTAVVDIPVTTAAMIPAAPVATVMMIMNRHRRSRYEQDPLQNVSTKLSTSPVIQMDHYRHWEVDVFGIYENDEFNYVRCKFDDENNDLFRLAKSQLLLLCVVIALFVVNVTTMPWTLLLGITFITPFVVIAGELIYVMALLIDWIPRPRLRSPTYITAVISDDDEYYQHYDSDNCSDKSCSSCDDGRCFRHLLSCHNFDDSSLLARIFKPFRWTLNSTTTAHSTSNGVNNRRWCIPKCCCCDSHHSWFTKCLENDRASSWNSDEDSDIECRLGFRNENAIVTGTTGVSPPQQLQNRPHHSQSIHVNRNYSYVNRRHEKHRRPKRKYQDEERRTRFFWLGASVEIFVVLLVCLLALLNAFTCEPVVVTTQKMINNDSSGLNIPTVNTTQHQQYLSPLVCLWPQYPVLTCCLACMSIAIAFPIYYGSLPILRMKIIVLFVMVCVFAVAFVHFTHRHVFIAASMSSLTPSYCSVDNNALDYQKVNSTINHNHNQEYQKLLKLQDLEQQRGARLNTAIVTVYVVVFVAAILVYSAYAHKLQDCQARHRVKINRDVRRLGVLRAAHQRTLFAIIPDHVADSLQKKSGNDVNIIDEELRDIQKSKNDISTNAQPNLVSTMNHQGREKILAHIPSPLYHCSHPTVVVVFATIVSQNQMSFTTTAGGIHYNQQSYRQFEMLNIIFSEFDRLLDNQKFRGLVEKIKLVNNTYMFVVGLQYHESRLLVTQREEIRRRNNETCHYNGREKGYDVESYSNSRDIDVTQANGFELYDVVSANHVISALDFVRDMRRTLHQHLLMPVGSMHNSQSTQFTLQVGVNVGPVFAGLVGCNDGIWKRPQFDVWGITVDVASQMDTTGVPGCTQVTSCVVEVMKSVKDSEYEFAVRTKPMLNNNNKIVTYFVREKFECHEAVVSHSCPQRQLSDHCQQQQHWQAPMVQKKHLHHHMDLNQKQWQPKLQEDQKPFKQPVIVRPSPNTSRMIMQKSECDQPHDVTPVVTVHPQHSYYNAMIQKEPRHKCSESKHTVPPPPPPRSPPPTHDNYSIVQHHNNRDKHVDQRQRSTRGIESVDDKQPKWRVCDTTTTVTYARPQTQHQKQKNNQSSLPSSSEPAPRGMILMFGDDSKRQSPQNALTVTNIIPTGASNHIVRGTTMTNNAVHPQQQPLRRPNVLNLQNTTTGTAAIKSKKNFDADRPLPAPPRSSDTVAGRQRQHHDPRRRRRQQQTHNKSHSSSTKPQQLDQSEVNIDPSGVTVPMAWPSLSSFRSPISVNSFVSVSSPLSSLSSSGSTDAGDTTTSHNNYNTTTTASSSDDSFGCNATEDCEDIGMVDTEEFDTAAFSAAVSPIYHRYREQQPHLLHRQWSPSTNSSPVRRSSSFRSPLSAGDTTVASSSSLRSPPLAVYSTASSIGGTQSLNRRRVRPTNIIQSGPNSSGRRRRRRQQQQNNTSVTGRPSPLSDVQVLPDDTDVIINPITPERDGSPPLSPWKKQLQLQRRQGTGGPEFTDEIRRILLLDHHKGNMHQQQRGLLEEKEVQVCKYPGIKEANDEIMKQSLEGHQNRSIVNVMKGRKPNNNDENNQQNERINAAPAAITAALMTAGTENKTLMTSFEERERQITEQVKRQQDEVMNRLQEYKNDVVAAVTTEARHRVQGMTEFSEWSDDGSIEPLSSLLEQSHRKQRIGLTENVGDYEASSIVTATDGEEYTSGGDADGYTTTGYTTDDAALNVDTGMEVLYSTAVDLPVASLAQHLDDNLSTINDTGLTDAEAALSDVNSMIYYNDCNENNRCRSRRQSSLGSCMSRYTSDSFCEDDDDDDDFNDSNEFFFHKRYHMEQSDVCDDSDDNSGHNFRHLLQLQQLSPTQPSSLSPLDGVYTDNNDRRLPEQHWQQSRLSAFPQACANNATLNIIQTPTMSEAIAAVTTANSNSVVKNATNNSSVPTSTISTAVTNTNIIATTTITNSKIELDKPELSSGVNNVNTNIS